MINIPEFATKEELFDYLRLNKRIHIQAKKAEFKHADAVVFSQVAIDNETGVVSKAIIDPAVMEIDKFNVTCVINTTNILDSHSDVHIPGLWTKTLKEQKYLLHLQEHKMEFDHIISDNVTATAKMINWSDIGYSYKGQTQALIFVSEVDKERNEYMAELYAKDWVKNHSVGMRYVTLELCMNSEAKYDVEEKAAWDKYLPMVVNQDAALEQGYFWAVTEAKLIEGSAVPLGSNQATPTISVGKIEPSEDTQKNEPIEITQEKDQPNQITEFLTNLKTTLKN